MLQRKGTSRGKDHSLLVHSPRAESVPISARSFFWLSQVGPGAKALDHPLQFSQVTAGSWIRSEWIVRPVAGRNLAFRILRTKSGPGFLLDKLYQGWIIPCSLRTVIGVWGTLLDLRTSVTTSFELQEIFRIFWATHRKLPHFSEY